MTADLEKRVSDLEEMVAAIPAALNTRFDAAAADRARIRADIADLKADISQLTAEVKALPRVIAEMLDAKGKS